MTDSFDRVAAMTTTSGAPITAAAAVDAATASAVIDLDAFAANIATLAAHVRDAHSGPADAPAVMVVVKADAYGHGLLPCARTARAAGADWLGVATPGEALALRAAGDRGPLLAWLYGPDEDLTPLVAAGVDVSAQSAEQLSRLVAAAGTTEQVARVHLKVDTGLSRNGAPAADWPQLCALAAEAEQFGAVSVVGVWSHLAAADEPGHPSIAVQHAAFEEAVRVAEAAGLRPQLRHLANSAAALVLPALHYDLVRIGIAAYGIDPAPGLAASAGVELAPVMTLRAQLVNVKRLPAGSGVSYGWTWTAPQEVTVGLVPLGYADGVPRIAGNRAEVGWAGGRAPVRGRICMDQFVVELTGAGGSAAGSRGPAEGDEVVLFGPGGRAGDSAPTAQDWAVWCDTIGYEIVTRIGPRVPRTYRGGEVAADG